MCAFHTVVVGTDGSVPGRKAIDHASWIAAVAEAKLVIVHAYAHRNAELRDHSDDALGDEAWGLHGNAPVYSMLNEAREIASAAGAKDIELRPVVGTPVNVLLEVAEEVKADLLVVGNLGMTGFAGRLLGSVPDSVSHKAKCDVLIVHTRD